VLWHEERAPIIADIIKLPVLGICSDRPEMLRPAMETAAPE
jgi:glycerophosphoryl diester phosphodiesterase